MSFRLKKYLIIASAYLAVLYPLCVRYAGMSWSSDLDSILINLFPGFGLLAFGILWLHAMSGVFEPWLRDYFDFDYFVHVSASIILVSLILHPLLLFILIDFNFGPLFSSSSAGYIRLGVIGWILLITYDIGKFLKKKSDFFVKNWQNILTISTIGFILTFFHSLWLGHDLQSGHLRIIWIFYGVTAILATIYTYGIKRFILK